MSNENKTATDVQGADGGVLGSYWVLRILIVEVLLLAGAYWLNGAYNGEFSQVVAAILVTIAVLLLVGLIVITAPFYIDRIKSR